MKAPIVTAIIVVGLVIALGVGISMQDQGGSGGKGPVVLIETTKGDIKVQLFEDKAPITVKNFMQYVEDKHYDGTIFHRVIKGFMIQGGGFDQLMREKPTRAPIKNESANGLSNKRGTIAMARTAIPDSATAQFYINVVDNQSLDRKSARDGVGYCVFGEVIEGMNVVDAIVSVKTGEKSGMDDVPLEPIVIKSIRKVE
jgi:cyclophilin family peptidyl-prolyl cis-trans isomerase